MQVRRAVVTKKKESCLYNSSFSRGVEFDYHAREIAFYKHAPGMPGPGVLLELDLRVINGRDSILVLEDYNGRSLEACLATAGSREPFYEFYHMDDILERPEEFEKIAIRHVLGKACPHSFNQIV